MDWTFGETGDTIEGILFVKMSNQGCFCRSKYRALFAFFLCALCRFGSIPEFVNPDMKENCWFFSSNFIQTDWNLTKGLKFHMPEFCLTVTLRVFLSSGYTLNPLSGTGPLSYIWIALPLALSTAIRFVSLKTLAVSAVVSLQIYC